MRRDAGRDNRGTGSDSSSKIRSVARYDSPGYARGIVLFGKDKDGILQGSIGCTTAVLFSGFPLQAATLHRRYC